MIYGVTGSREPRGLHRVRCHIETWQDVTGVVTGAQRGVDAYAARIAWVTYPQAEHTLIVPAAPHDDELVKDFKRMVDPPNRHPNVHIIFLPPSTEPYKARNAEIVTRSDRVHGYPLRGERQSPRSGTWQTLRMARSADKLGDVLLLDLPGEPPWLAGSDAT